MEVMSDMGIARKLDHICQGLTLPAEEWKAAEFLTNTENAQRINGLVEDIHEALMDYQVCILSHSFSTMSDLHVRLHYSKISTMKVTSSLYDMSPHPMPSRTNQ